VVASFEASQYAEQHFDALALAVLGQQVGGRWFSAKSRRPEEEQRDNLEAGEQRDTLEDGEQRDNLVDGKQPDNLEHGEQRDYLEDREHDAEFDALNKFAGSLH
jgi:hypothetical protein